MTITEPGIVTDLDERTYHADPVPESSLSVSGAKTILDCPRAVPVRTGQPSCLAGVLVRARRPLKVLGRGVTCVTVPADLLAKNGAASTSCRQGVHR